MKNLLLGKKPLERKYLPKVIEHLYIFFSALIFTIISSIFLIMIFLNGEKNLYEKFFSVLNQLVTKFFIATAIAIVVLNLVHALRIILILKKTESGKQLVILELIVIFSIILLPLNLFIALACLKYNEIVYE